MSARERIIQGLGVKPAISTQVEISQRVRLLCDAFKTKAALTFIVPVSGGTESIVAGLLAKKAADRLKLDGYQVHVMALVFAPLTGDSAAYQQMKTHVRPDQFMEIDPDGAATALTLQMSDRLELAQEGAEEAMARDTTARLISASRHIVAGSVRGIVVGTANANAAIYRSLQAQSSGSTPSDISPLSGLSLRQIHELALALGVTGSLSSEAEFSELGNAPVSNSDIDNFLEGCEIDPEVSALIVRKYAEFRKWRSLAYDL